MEKGIIRKGIIKDTVYASPIFSYLALNSPIGAYVSIMSSTDHSYFYKQVLDFVSRH